MSNLKTLALNDRVLVRGPGWSEPVLAAVQAIDIQPDGFHLTVTGLSPHGVHFTKHNVTVDEKAEWCWSWPT